MKYIITAFLLSYSLGTLGYANEYGHNQLMALGHQLLKQCGKSSAAKRYTENDINSIIVGSTSVDMSYSPFSLYNRLFDWHFYKAKDGVKSLKKSNVLFVDATFIDPWEKLSERYPEATNRSDQLSLLGGFAHYIEDMANPAHVIPVFHMAGVKDGIDDFPTKYYQQDAKDIRFDPEVCNRLKLFGNKIDYTDNAQNPINQILHLLAKTTVENLKTPIPHCTQFRWEQFYKYPDKKGFWGSFHKKSLNTVMRRKDKQFVKHTNKEKVVIGYEGLLNFGNPELESCAFIKASYQPLVDRLYENAIIADAILLESQSSRF